MLNAINTNSVNAYANTSSKSVDPKTASILDSADAIIKAQEEAKQNADSFDVSNESKNASGVYTAKDFTSSNKVEEVDVKALAAARMDDFSNMLNKMIGGQAKASTTASDMYADSVKKAQESIAEGGEWSPENVAENILDMAKSLSGGDPENFAVLKEAVEKGFKAAEKAWGGELPSITKDTYDKVMAGFDAWEKELFGTNEETATQGTTVVE